MLCNFKEIRHIRFKLDFIRFCFVLSYCNCMSFHYLELKYGCCRVFDVTSICSVNPESFTEKVMYDELSLFDTQNEEKNKQQCFLFRWTRGVHAYKETWWYNQYQLNRKPFESMAVLHTQTHIHTFIIHTSTESRSFSLLVVLCTALTTASIT